jgi:hypothetical protein
MIATIKFRLRGIDVGVGAHCGRSSLGRVMTSSIITRTIHHLNRHKTATVYPAACRYANGVQRSQPRTRALSDIGINAQLRKLPLIGGQLHYAFMNTGYKRYWKKKSCLFY